MKKGFFLQIKNKMQEWENLTKYNEQHPLFYMLFSSSELQKATSLAALSWSMLTHKLLTKMGSVNYCFTFSFRYTMPWSRINHITGLQRAILTPPIENTFFFPNATNYKAEQGATDNTTDYFIIRHAKLLCTGLEIH